jgi:hypothetical protein
MCNASEVRNTSDVKSLRLRVATLVHLRYVADECQNTDSLNIHELNQPKVLHILAGVGAPIFKGETTMYQIELVWNREFHFVPYGDTYVAKGIAKKAAQDLLNMGDGASVKKVQVIDLETGKIV